MTTATCPLHWAHDLPDTNLASRLAAAGLHPNVVADLVRDRHTTGAEHRIEAELGPLPDLVASGLVPAATTDPALCTCGQEPAEQPAEPDPTVPDLMAALEASLAAAKAARPAPPPPPHQLADELEYDELAWAQAAADAAEAQAVADAAELGW